MPVPALRRRVLHQLQKALYLSPLHPLHQRWASSAGTVILMYHSVPDASVEAWIDPRNAMPLRLFERQMGFLARHRNVVPMNTLVEALKRDEPLPPGSVVITFDDGYRDNLICAAPVLERFGLPATVYLATGYVERAEPQWIDQLFIAFTRRTRSQLEVGDARFDLDSPAGSGLAYQALASEMLESAPAARAERLGRVVRDLRPEGEPPRLTLDWSEVRQLRDAFPAIELGVHTREHVDLVGNRGIADDEIAACIHDFEAAMGTRPAHFSYPYGRMDADLARSAARADFASAVTTHPPGKVSSRDQLLRMPRVEAPADALLFRFFTGGAWPELSQRLLRRV